MRPQTPLSPNKETVKCMSRRGKIKSSNLASKGDTNVGGLKATKLKYNAKSTAMCSSISGALEIAERHTNNDPDLIALTCYMNEYKAGGRHKRIYT